MSGALELMQIGVAQGIEHAARVMPPNAQVDYRPYLSQMELSTLVRRANGEDMLAFDQTMMSHGINPDEHEDHIQQSIAFILRDAVCESLSQIEPDATVQQALRCYQPKSVEHLKAVGLAVSEAAWSDDPTVQTNGAAYLGVLGIGTIEAKDAPYGTDGRPLSEIKAQILAESLVGREINTERLRSLVGQISDKYDWDVHVTRIHDDRLTVKKAAAVAATAAVVTVGIANPASADPNTSGSSPVIVAGLPQEQSAVVAIDQQPLVESIVTTPQVNPRPKITIIKAGTSIDQPITPTLIPAQSITTQEAHITAQPSTATPSTETVPESVPVIVAGDAPQTLVAPQNSSDVTMPSVQDTSTETMPAAMPSNESSTPEVAQSTNEIDNTAENIDSIDVQIQLGDQLIPIVRAGIKAKSYAVLQGGEAKPNDKNDHMSEGLMSTSTTIIDWIDKARQDDPKILKELEAGWEAWRDDVLNNPDRFSQDQRDQVQQIEVQVQLYQESGFPEKATKLRVLATLNNILQEIITNPALYANQAIAPAEDTTPAHQESSGKNPYKHYKLNPAQLKVVDELADHRNWKDWQKETFINILERAVQIAYDKHISPVNLVSQSVLESGDYKTSLSRNQNNAFGIKGKGNAGSAELPTSEWDHDHYVKIMAQFAAFLSMADGVEFYASHLLQLKHYEDSRWFFKNPQLSALGLENQLNRRGQIEVKGRMAYATSPTYVKTLASMEKSLRLRELIPSDFFLNTKVPFDGTGKARPKVEFDYKAFHDNKELKIPNADKAMERAKKIANTNFNDPDYKEFCPGNYKNGKYVRCYNLCDHIAAYIWGNAHSGHETAYKHWKDVKDDKNAIVGTDREPPIGAFMFWGSGTGHVAVYLGDGKIITNDVNDRVSGVRGGMYIVDATQIEKKWGLKYHGWAIDGRLMHVNTDKIN